MTVYAQRMVMWRNGAFDSEIADAEGGTPQSICAWRRKNKLRSNRPSNQKRDSLCWDCENACGRCRWSKSLKPVNGWTAKATKIKCGSSRGREYIVDSFQVLKCPLFVPDEPRKEVAY